MKKNKENPEEREERTKYKKHNQLLEDVKFFSSNNNLSIPETIEFYKVLELQRIREILDDNLDAESVINNIQASKEEIVGHLSNISFEISKKEKRTV